MRDAGLQASKDQVANVRGRLHGRNPTQPAWLMGSHYDTVKDGGHFDGALGIIAAIAAVKALLIEVRRATFPLSPSCPHACTTVRLYACHESITVDSLELPRATSKAGWAFGLGFR